MLCSAPRLMRYPMTRPKTATAVSALFPLLLILSLLLGSRSAVRAQAAPLLLRAEANARAAFEAIHQQPEIGKKEYATSKLVRARLEALGGFSFVAIPALPTAVVAVLAGARPGRTICLRAELDAKEGVTETTSLSYSSRIPNVAHACGHDAHTAILLGVAEVLAQQRNELTGKVVFLFQPAEEVAGGADDIVADGVLQRLGVEAMFSQHVAPGLPLGKVAVSAGPVLAGSTSLTVTVHGRESHGASPEAGDDVPLAAATIAAALPYLPARKLNVISQPCVISLTSFSTGDPKVVNVIPGEASFRFTIRSFELLDAATPGQLSLRQLLGREVTGLAAAEGVTADTLFRRGAPATVNQEALYARLAPALQAGWGPDHLVAATRSMYSEDFAYYTASVPCLYFALGITSDGLGNAPVHTARFQVPPRALGTGIRFFLLLAREATKP